MEEKVIRQHYIPQMYLRRFCDPNGQLYAFDLSTQKGLRNLPRAFAQKKFFYDLPPEEMHSILESMFRSDTPGTLESLSQTQVVEKMLSNIEGAANTVLDGFENGTFDFSDEDTLVKLVTFLHTLSARTTKPRSMMQRIHEQTVPILRQFTRNADPSIAAYCNSTDDEYAKKLQIEQLLDPIQTAKFGVKLIENYNWYIGIVQSDIKLIISDNPAQMIDLGFNDCCFPISPDKAIIFRVKQAGAPMISEDASENGVIHLSAKSVLVYNLLQKGQAERFLFGDKTSIDILLVAEKATSVLFQRHDSGRENEKERG